MSCEIENPDPPMLSADAFRALTDFAAGMREIGVDNHLAFRKIVKDEAGFHGVGEIDAAWKAVGGKFIEDTAATPIPEASRHVVDYASRELVGAPEPALRRLSEVSQRAGEILRSGEAIPPDQQITTGKQFMDEVLQGTRPGWKKQIEQDAIRLASIIQKQRLSPGDLAGQVANAASGGVDLHHFLATLAGEDPASLKVRDAVFDAVLGRGETGPEARGSVEDQRRRLQRINEIVASDKGRSPEFASSEPTLDMGTLQEGADADFWNKLLSSDKGSNLSGTGEATGFDVKDTAQGERTLFPMESAQKVLGGLRDNYHPPLSKRRDPKTLDMLEYYGGYTYEKLTRLNGKRPQFEEWATHMIADTGKQIHPTDLTDTWDGMREFAHRRMVRPARNLRNAAMRKARGILNPEQLKQFLEDTKGVDPTADDAHEKFNDAIEALRKTTPMEYLKEVPGMRRAMRTAFDISALLNQGLVYTLDPSNAKNTGRNIPKMIQALANDNFARALMDQIWSSENRDLYEEFGQGLISKFGSDVDVLSHEENFQTRFFDQVAEASLENRPYRALTKDAIPALAGVAVGAPVSVALSPLVGVPAAALTGKLAHMLTRNMTWEGTREIQTVKRLPLENTAIGQLLQRMKLSEDGAIELETGLFGRGGLTSVARSQARGIRASERSYTAYLNLQRAQAMDRGIALLKDAGKLPETHPEAYQQLADIIGDLTGRASLGKLERSVPGGMSVSRFLAELFFSPKYSWSRVKTLTSTPARIAYSELADLAGGDGGTQAPAYLDPTVRRFALKSMSGAVAMYAGLTALAVALGAQVFLDWRHKDFLKWRFKHRTYDFTGGFSGVMRMLGAMSSVAGEMMGKSEYNRIVSTPTYQRPGFTLPGDLRGQKTSSYTGKGMDQSIRDAFDQFVQGKESPLVGDVFKTVFGRDFYGDPVYWRRRVEDRKGILSPDVLRGMMKDAWSDFGPLSPVDLLDAADEKQDIQEQLLSFFAIAGANTKANVRKKD